MSEENEPKEKMSESAKLVIAVIGAIPRGLCYGRP